MEKFELIIFDCDGVLVDSERITTVTFSKVLEEECGLFLELDVLVDIFMGQTSQRCLQIIEEMIGRPPPANLESRYQSSITKALQKSVTTIDGIEHVLESLTIPYCVASAGSHEKMQTTLGKTNLLKYFNGNLFSTHDVDRGKPHPDVFIHAAENMKCRDLSRCLVIEDSPLGVKGGVAAGMVVFGFADLVKKQKLYNSGAHRVFTQMDNLADEISIYQNQ